MEETRIGFPAFTLAYWADVETRTAHFPMNITLPPWQYGSVTDKGCRVIWQLVQYYRPRICCEIGTFTGRSATILATHATRVYTCDGENDLFPATEIIKTHPMVSSTDMLKSIKEPVDFFFFDGRIQHDDLQLIQDLSHPRTVYVFDDFYGIEKGVVNAAKMNLLKHILIEPRESIAVILNTQAVRLTRQ